MRSWTVRIIGRYVVSLDSDDVWEVLKCAGGSTKARKGHVLEAEDDDTVEAVLANVYLSRHCDDGRDQKSDPEAPAS